MTDTANYPTIDAIVRPEGSLRVLSRAEVGQLLETSQSGLLPVFKGVALAVLNCGSEVGDGHELAKRYPDFDVELQPTERGISLALSNAPAAAFVDGKMIRGLREQLFSALRDIVYVKTESGQRGEFDLQTSAGITDAVFHILRNADVLKPDVAPRRVVCWGGHAISRQEYVYAKEVGHELGLRGLDICTGCGAGAMKAPMKGAQVAHLKQRIRDGQFLGISEPGIIASESPNPVVNDLVIMPDIEKRLEAFVRMGHAVIVFPGGVGTAEEIFYFLSILLHPANKDQKLPLIFTGPAGSEDYFQHLDTFLVECLGPSVRNLYQIIPNDPQQVAITAQAGVQEVYDYRSETGDAWYYNWQLNIEIELQSPFVPGHKQMTNLNLQRQQPLHTLAANLRRAFSGIVAGNVKADGVLAVEQNGPFELKGDAGLMAAIDKLLAAFVAQRRMKVTANAYHPCYKLIY